MDYTVRLVTAEDYDALYELWSSTEQSRRALNPVDDSREGIERYLKRNPNTCFAAVREGRIIGVILTGHDRKASRKYSAWCSRTMRLQTLSGSSRAIP